MGVSTFRQCMVLLGFFSWPSRAQVAVETIKVLVVLVKWSNHENRALPTQDDIHQLWNGPGNTTLVPGESVADWMTSNSYGKYQVQADVANWYRLVDTEAEASFGNMGSSVNSANDSKSLEGILQPALENTGFNLTDYVDANGDLIGVIFVHSGYAAEQGGVDGDGADYLNRIASKAWTADVQIADGVRLQTFATVSAFKGLTNGTQMAGIGHHIHEWLHARFGLHNLNDLGGRCTYIHTEMNIEIQCSMVCVTPALTAILFVALRTFAPQQTTTAQLPLEVLVPLESCHSQKDQDTMRPIQEF